MIHRISISHIFLIIIASCLTTSIYFIQINNKDDNRHYLSFKQQNYTVQPSKKSKQKQGHTVEKILKLNEWYNINKLKDKKQDKSFRILHVITTSTDENNRLKGKLLPTLLHAIHSIQEEENWSIDVYLILGYTLSKDQRAYIKNVLPEGVGLEIWENAIPYSTSIGGRIMATNTFLARQHRFVLKDKLEYYDFFSCWEDDMRVTAEHIKSFLYLSNELDQLREKAKKMGNNTTITKSSFKSPLTVDQIDRLVPGFIRVEVLTSPTKNKDNTVPFDTLCCSPPKIIDNSYTASKTNQPMHEDVVLWETAMQGISLRYIPNSDYAFARSKWVGLLPSGNPKNKNPNSNIKSISTYPRGSDENPRLFAQQGGWMLTKQQILLFHTKTCPGGFLPPYNNTKHWRNNGLQNSGNAVEFWSGGFHLFLNCHVKRVISIEPELYARQLIFHTSLNKQIQRRDRLVGASKLLKQIWDMIPESEHDVELKT